MIAPGPTSARRIAVLVKGYPRLSETFIAQELLALERRGLTLSIVSLRQPTDPAVHALHREIRAPVLHLPEYLDREPARVLRAWRTVRRWPTYRAARSIWLRDLRRDPSPNRIRRFGQALVLASELPPDVALLYVHYLHTPGSVGRYAAKLTGLPFCISAHAKDIWTTPEWDKRDKLHDCRWLTTCTAAGAEHLRALAPDARVHLIRHGLDPSRFPAPDREQGPDGRDPARPVRLLGVARLVSKKGVGTLLDALAALPSSIHWRYEHIGGGPLSKALQAQAERLGIADRIRWRGPLPQEEVLRAYREADLFVLASRIADDGDRDGLPNVLLEAGAQELPVVASRIAAIPELIENGLNGRLVPSGDPMALMSAVLELIVAPAARLRLARAARRRVLERFGMDGNVDRLAALLREEVALPTDAAA